MPVEAERCAECGFDGSNLSKPDTIAAIRSLGPRWSRLLAQVDDPDLLRRRPSPEVWSAAEYADHTVGVLELLLSGLEDVLKGEEPVYPAIEPGPAGPDRSNDIDLPGLPDRLSRAAGALADRAEKMLPEQWEWKATLGDQDLDAGWIIRHGVHDPTHHLRDVRRGLEALGAPLEG